MLAVATPILNAIGRPRRESTISWLCHHDDLGQARGDSVRSNLTIPRLVRGDFDSWESLWQTNLRFYEADLSDEITRNTLARLVDETDGLVGLVAQGEQSLVGLAHLVFHASTWSSCTYCYLADLFVSPAARGTSVAQALFAPAYEEADRRSATHDYCQTQQYNSPDRSLYDHVGHLTSLISISDSQQICSSLTGSATRPQEANQSGA